MDPKRKRLIIIFALLVIFIIALILSISLGLHFGLKSGDSEYTPYIIPNSQSHQTNTTQTTTNQTTTQENTTHQNTTQTTTQQNTANPDDQTEQPIITDPFESYPYLQGPRESIQKPIKSQFNVSYPKYRIKPLYKMDLDNVKPLIPSIYASNVFFKPVSDPMGEYYPLGDALLDLAETNYNVPLLRDTIQSSDMPLKSPTTMIQTSPATMPNKTFNLSTGDPNYICVGNALGPNSSQPPNTNYKCLPKRCIIKEPALPIIYREYAPFGGDYQKYTLYTSSGPKTDDFYDLSKYFTSSLVSKWDGQNRGVGAIDPYAIPRYRINPECDADLL